jgi:CRISPR-associated protein Csd1
MILQSLCSYYDRITESPNIAIATEGFNSEKIHFALVIDTTGKLVQVLDLRDTKGKKKVFKSVVVPQGPKKSVQIAASFLWGNTCYVLGADDKGKAKRTAKCHEAFNALHKNLLGTSGDTGAKAILGFLSQWNPENAPKLPDWQEMLKSNLVFQLDGDRSFIHERPEVRKLWLASLEAAEPSRSGMCLVSGQIAPLARVHAAIKGFRSTGAALVSFNADAYESCGKTQNFNAPVSESRASAYTKALNHLLASNSNRIQIGDATTVFWTERASPIEGFFGLILDPRDAAGDDKELAVFLESVREGKLPHNIDGAVKFYILGLSPNASRLSVRFWHVSTVKDISEKLGYHFRDLAMVRPFETDPEYPGMWRLLRETSNQKSKDGPPPLLCGAVMQAILNGTPYPQTLLSAVIGRIRAEQSAKDKNGRAIHNVNYMRAAIIKAVLVRKKRILNQGMEVSMALDKENKNIAYLLGRLFAVLEKAQQDAIPGANTTIKDRFYGSASATPRVVFPQLLRLAQHHIQKAEYGKVRDKQIEEIVCDIKEFPAHMGLDEQGLFAIGYYHQRQDFFKKNTN